MGESLKREVVLPLYEYRCRKCNAVVEKIQKFSEPPLTQCEKCGGKLERLLSPSAFQFKGTGWYVTDYARKSAAPKSESGSGSKDTKGSEPAGDAKKAAEPRKAGESSESKSTTKK